MYVDQTSMNETWSELKKKNVERAKDKNTRNVVFICVYDVWGNDKKVKEGQTVDALALGGDEGRDKLRKARGRCK